MLMLQSSSVQPESLIQSEAILPPDSDPEPMREERKNAIEETLSWLQKVINPNDKTIVTDDINVNRDVPDNVPATTVTAEGGGGVAADIHVSTDVPEKGLTTTISAAISEADSTSVHMEPSVVSSSQKSIPARPKPMKFKPMKAFNKFLGIRKVDAKK